MIENAWISVAAAMAAAILFTGLRNGRSEYRGLQVDRATMPMRFWTWLAVWLAILAMCLWRLGATAGAQLHLLR